MPFTLPSGRDESNRTVEWCCTNCGHRWEGKTKAARPNGGNPTCSGCGKRSGAARAEEVNQPLPNNDDDRQISTKEAVVTGIVAFAANYLAETAANRNRRRM